MFILEVANEDLHPRIAKIARTSTVVLLYAVAG